MIIKKIILILVLFILLVNPVIAERYVDNNFRYGEIDEYGNLIPTSTPVNNVGVRGYVCSSPNCGSVSGDLWNGAILDSVDDSIQLVYPTTLLSVYGYGVYMFKEGYIPYEVHATWWGTSPYDPAGPYTRYLTRLRGCEAGVDNLYLEHSNWRANVKADVRSPIKGTGPLIYIPPFLASHYTTDVNVNLEVRKSIDDSIYYTETKVVSIPFSGIEEVIFSFEVSDGDYDVYVYSTTEDEKCVDYQIDGEYGDLSIGCSEDSDGDGYYAIKPDCLTGDDCDDADTSIYPEALELCDGKDNDCDSLIDEDFANLGDSCTAGLGECQAYGDYVCSEDSLGTECDAVAGEPLDEICDTLDNDCDSFVDEEMGQTTCGFGVCEHTVDNCVGGEEQICNPYEGASAELCDGLDNDCDDLIDEDFIDLGDECSAGVGECQSFGEYFCKADGSGAECDAVAGEPSPELCDGLDNDCDNLIDEDFIDLGDECSAGIGECQAFGEYVCKMDGLGTECDAVAGPSEPEICDGLDNDCDGFVDEDLTESCGSGLCEGVRICVDGDLGSCSTEDNYVGECGICDSEGNAEPQDNLCYDFCKGDIRNQAYCNPTTYECNYIEEDCNDYNFDYCEDNMRVRDDYTCLFDDGGGWVPPPPGGYAVCGFDGTEILEECADLCGAECKSDEDCDDLDPATEDSCVDCSCIYTVDCVDNDRDGYYAISPDCSQGDDCDDTDANVNPAASELCDGLDNDCDGLIDEVFTDLGDSCSAGIGECQAFAEYVCKVDGSGTECNAVAGEPSQELCDGLDNDCDGLIDEELTRPTTCGLGACSGNMGQEICDNGVWGSDNCDPFAGATSEICNNIDDDCDGLIDEDFVDLGDSCSAGIGECQAFGEYICRVDGYGTTCDAVAGEPSAELCDDLDNDCDGLIDETFTNLGDSCTVGSGDCLAYGNYVCSVGGSGTECDAIPGDSEDEVCDGVDNDCDGTIDEGGNSLCDDGLYCNGGEICNGVSGCQEGADVDCGDEVSCTSDSCDEDTDSCDNLPDDDICSDGLFCDGIETCDTELGCVGGVPPVVNDGVSCTIDSCDEENDLIINLPDNSLCNDWNECTKDICDAPQGCSNPPEPAGTSCDGDDSIDCTIENCDGSGSCVLLEDQCGCYIDMDCSDLNDQCNLGKCDLITHTCYASLLPDGTSCDDNEWCSVNDVCDDGVCSNGAARDCSGNNIEGINTCDNHPDDNPFTLDYRGGFESFCDEEGDSCTTGNSAIAHNCNVNDCGAECEKDTDCECGDDGCIDADDDGDLDDYADYPQYGACFLDDCSCELGAGEGGYCEPEITVDDGVNCGECEVDADCNDGVYCNGQESCVGGFCQAGMSIDCSGYDITEIDVCDNEPDNNPVTRDYFAGFNSQCVEEQGGGCTLLNTVPFTHVCDKGCGAQCETANDCDDSDKYTEDRCVGCVCQNIEVRCFGNKDCYDGVLLTVDVCVNPGTTESYCEHRKPRLDFIPREKFFISTIRINELVYDEVEAGDQLFIDLRFENIGRYNTEYATIRVTVPELGISRKLGPFRGPDIDDAMSKGLYLELPEDAEPGVYTARISLSDLNGIRRTKHRDFRIVK